jgi:hypothetical protein
MTQNSVFGKSGAVRQGQQDALADPFRLGGCVRPIAYYASPCLAAFCVRSVFQNEKARSISALFKSHGAEVTPGSDVVGEDLQRNRLGHHGSPRQLR